MTPRRTQRSKRPYELTRARRNWTEEEHQRFLEGLKTFGRKWEKVSKVVVTRDAAQLRSHAQKFYKRVAEGLEEAPFELPQPRHKCTKGPIEGRREVERREERRKHRRKMSAGGRKLDGRSSSSSSSSSSSDCEDTDSGWEEDQEEEGEETASVSSSGGKTAREEEEDEEEQHVPHKRRNTSKGGKQKKKKKKKKGSPRTMRGERRVWRVQQSHGAAPSEHRAQVECPVAGKNKGPLAQFKKEVAVAVAVDQEEKVRAENHHASPMVSSMPTPEQLPSPLPPVSSLCPSLWASPPQPPPPPPLPLVQQQQQRQQQHQFGSCFPSSPLLPNLDLQHINLLLFCGESNHSFHTADLVDMYNQLQPLSQQWVQRVFRGLAQLFSERQLRQGSN